MREFMDYVQSAFYAGTGWDRDNSYSSLNATSDALLSFATPRGLRLTLSSLATPQFATSYQLGTVGVVDGSISYLYSTVPLSDAVAPSERVPLPDLLRSYRPLNDLARNTYVRHGWAGGVRDKKETLAYGRLYLPMSMLEALVVRRLSPTLQWQMSAVSGQALRSGGTVLSMLQYDVGRYGVEGLASSDGGLLGVRGLYNFGGDVAHLDASREKKAQDQGGGGGGNNGERDRIHGRFSAGAELYYGALNKSGGMSFGVRFASLPLPSQTGTTPLTATMTINPLMGSVSWTYAVVAGGFCSLATRMSFNVYSYESDWAVGMELWRKKAALPLDVDAEGDAPPPPTVPRKPERSFQAKMEWRLDDPVPPPDTPNIDDPEKPAFTSESVSISPPTTQLETQPAAQPTTPPTTSPAASPASSPAIPRANLPASLEPEVVTKERSFRAKMEWRLDEPEEKVEDEYAGVLKARLDQHLRLGLLWEGRAKSLLFSLGSGIDLRRLDSPFRTLGLEVQFSS